MQVQSEPPALKSVVAYYWALRILANAYAIAGIHKVPVALQTGQTVVYAPLDVNVQYADFCLRQVADIVPTQVQQLGWLQAKDEYTRTQDSHDRFHASRAQPR